MRGDVADGQGSWLRDPHSVFSSAVAIFDVLSSQFAEIGKRRGWTRYGPNAVLRIFSAAMMRRCKVRSLPNAISDSIRACWPGRFGEVMTARLDSLMNRLPSKSSIQRWQFSADIAFMLSSRDMFQNAMAQHGITSWYGADSSTQFGEQWFLFAFLGFSTKIWLRFDGLVRH